MVKRKTVTIKQVVFIPAKPEEIFEAFVDGKSTQRSLEQKRHLTQKLEGNSRPGTGIFLENSLNWKGEKE